MKTLVLIRHAKSSWDDLSVPDHDRPLNERGLRDAPAMGLRLHERGVDPDMVLSSTAVRARRTAELIAAELGFEPQGIVTEAQLYAASPGHVLAVIRALSDDAECVLVFGHNPELSELAHSFSPEIVHMPTCAVAEFVFDVAKWADLGDASPTSVTFESPRQPRG